MNLADMKREFERVAQERRDAEDALRFLLYLARRDHRHLVIDKNPESGDAWISVPAPLDGPVEVFVFNSSIVPSYHYHGASAWNLTSSTGS